MLACYGEMEKYDAVRAWYDGYRFGKVDVYCPWDVISYCHALKMDPEVRPQNYWVNTSENDIIKRLIHGAKEGTKAEIEHCWLPVAASESGYGGCSAQGDYPNLFWFAGPVQYLQGLQRDLKGK